MKQWLDVERTGHGRFGDIKTSNVRVEYEKNTRQGTNISP